MASYLCEDCEKVKDPKESEPNVVEDSHTLCFDCYITFCESWSDE